MEFEWDLSKERINLRKHGVSCSEAVETFLDARRFQLTDQTHSEEEARFYWVGKSDTGRVLATRFTHRGQKIRMIGSAEWRKFRRLVDETTQPA